MSIPYRFMPLARRGLARSHRNPDAAGAPLPTRPQIKRRTYAAGQAGRQCRDCGLGQRRLTLYGPADIIGIDPRLVVRTDPRPNITNFEPNYLASSTSIRPTSRGCSRRRRRIPTTTCGRGSCWSWWNAPGASAGAEAAGGRCRPSRERGAGAGPNCPTSPNRGCGRTRRPCRRRAKRTGSARARS